jgi:beta-galactosidase
VGLEFALDQRYDNVTYYGRGPWSTYSDRKFERMGLFSLSVDEMWIEYSRPQENGNREDTRWAALTDADGAGVLFIGGPTFGFGAKFYSQDAMSGPRYSYQMERSDAIHVNVDIAQCGVGGNNSWNAPPMEAYQLGLEPRSYRFRIIPITDAKSAQDLYADRYSWSTP